jgi:hypothetical protein
MDGGRLHLRPFPIQSGALSDGCLKAPWKDFFISSLAIFELMEMALVFADTNA